VTWYGFVRALVVPLARVVFRVRVTGLEHVPPTGVYILAPSHRSAIDPAFAAFATRRRIRFMAKREIFTTRLGRRAFTALGAIEVDRGATDRGALRASKAALDAGEPLGIFPEGTRRDDPEVEDLFDGCSYLALKLGVAIVPVGIGGSDAIMAKGRRIPRLPRIAVVIGAPIEPPPSSGVTTRSEIAGLTATLRARLQECFDEATRRSAGAGTEVPGAGSAATSGSGPGGRSGVAAEGREHG
jgi:1-acyl-sn-glycerol-3-phosphate acyltransferase